MKPSIIRNRLIAIIAMVNEMERAITRLQNQAVECMLEIETGELEDDASNILGSDREKTPVLHESD